MLIIKTEGGVCHSKLPSFTNVEMPLGASYLLNNQKRLWIVEGDKTRRRERFNSACSFAGTHSPVSPMNMHEQKVHEYLEMYCVWITQLHVVAKRVALEVLL